MRRSYFIPRALCHVCMFVVFAGPSTYSEQNKNYTKMSVKIQRNASHFHPSAVPAIVRFET